MSRRVAVADIGTNTLKLSVTEVFDNGKSTVIDARADTVRLGAGIRTSGVIDPERMFRAMVTLREYQEVAKSLGAEALIGVATAALRMASNGQEFLDLVDHNTEWSIRVISGDEEAHLTFIGLAQFLPQEGHVLLADIGGGSTELIDIRDGAHVASRSIDIGSGTLADRAFVSDPPGFEAVLAATEVATSVLKDALSIPSIRGCSLVLAGGNGLFLESFSRWPEPAVPFTPDAFPVLLEALATVPSGLLAEFLEIVPERARMLPAGGGIVKAIIDLVAPVTLNAVQSGIRGGLVLEWLGAHA